MRIFFEAAPEEIAQGLRRVLRQPGPVRLIPGDGFDDLFPDEDADYFLLNLVLVF